MQTTPLPSAMAFERQSTIRSDQSYRALTRQNEPTPSQISRYHGSEISSNSDKVDSIISSKSIIVPLFYDEVIRFVSKNVVGMEINATNLLDLRRVKKNN